MNAEDLKGTLDFLAAAENLKNVLRSGFTSAGRPESTAEHTWRVCLMVLVFEGAVPGVDMAKALKMAIVHDLGEAIGGDIPAPQQKAEGAKTTAERRDLETLLAPLPEAMKAHILVLWDEYNAAATPEARLIKALDKLETIQQHNQGRNPPGFDYAFNLDYGRRYTAYDPLIARIRDVLDAGTRARADNPSS